MDRDAASQFVMRLFARVPGFDTEMVHGSLERSRTVDAEGRQPSEPGYEPTIDEWFAAAEVAEALHVQELLSDSRGAGLKQFSSEGSSFVFEEGADWHYVAGVLRGRSRLAAAGGWAMVEVPGESLPFHPRSAGWPGC